MSSQDQSVDRELERTGRRLRVPGRVFLMLAAVLAMPGIILVAAAHGAASEVGYVLIALALAPVFVAGALMLPGLVTWWAARHKPFA